MMNYEIWLTAGEWHVTNLHQRLFTGANRYLVLHCMLPTSTPHTKSKIVYGRNNQEQKQNKNKNQQRYF